jgi:hypothetical protein
VPLGVSPSRRPTCGAYSPATMRALLVSQPSVTTSHTAFEILVPYVTLTPSR